MSPPAFRTLLLGIAGMGGFLYGYDIGIIGAALLYLNKTIQLSATQESLVVAAVLAGGTASSLVAGVLADFLGRKRLMVASAVVFLISVAMIVLAQGFVPLLAGRTLQGLSAGMMAFVIPLYLAETLPAAIRGRGTASFQLLLTIGILISMAVGRYYTAGVEGLPADTTAAALQAAQDEAWRAMFLTAAWPGVVFLAGTLLVTESPRWLLRRGRESDTRVALERSRSRDEAAREFEAMRASLETPASAGGPAPAGSLWQRRYLSPFLLTCAVLALTQATGINSILQYLVVILKESGLGGTEAASRATWVTAVNVVFTLLGLLLVDRIGRKALLKLGTGGIAVALGLGAWVFWSLQTGSMQAGDTAGRLVTGCLMVFMAGFSTGPGVCVWLALSELMPTRIRSLGMGVGLLLNQGISTAIAAVFLPVVKSHGYAIMFAAWAVCSVGYFLVAAFWLPETKGRTLEEIEAEFS